MIGKLGRHGQSSDFMRGVVIIAGGGAIAQILPVALTPAISRLYSPSELGILGLYTSFIGIASPLGTLQYSKAIVSAENEGEAVGLGLLGLYLVLPISLLSTLVLWWLIGASYVGFGDLPMLSLPFMFLSLVLTSLFAHFRYWHIRSAAYSDISRAVIWQSVGRVSVQLVAGLAQAGWLGLVLGEAVGRGLGLRRLAANSGTLRTTIQNSFSSPEVWKVISKYRKFPLLSAPSILLNTLALSLAVPLVSSGFGVEDAGQFSMATRMMLLPLVLIGTAVGDVFHNRLAMYARSDPPQARPFFYKVSAALLVVGILPAAAVLMFGQELWSLLLGAQWELSGRIAQALIPWVLVQFVVAPVSQVIPVYQRQELKLVYDALALASVVGVLSIGPSRGMSLVETCTLLGWSQATVYAVYFLLLTRTVAVGSRGRPAS